MPPFRPKLPCRARRRRCRAQSGLNGYQRAEDVLLTHRHRLNIVEVAVVAPSTNGLMVALPRPICG